jgi:hypothetical protein
MAKNSMAWWPQMWFFSMICTPTMPSPFSITHGDGATPAG